MLDPEVKAAVVVEAPPDTAEPLEPPHPPWHRLRDSRFTGPRISCPTDGSGVETEPGSLLLNVGVLSSVLDAVLDLGEARTRARRLTFAVSVDYAPPSLSIQVDAAAVRGLAALQFALDIDCYAIAGAAAAEPPFTPVVHRLGMELGRPLAIVLPPEPLVATAAGWQSPEPKIGGLVGRHVGALSRHLAPWQDVISATAALAGCSIWCESRGGWGRPGIVLTRRQLQSVAKLGARLDFRILVS